MARSVKLTKLKAILESRGMNFLDISKCTGVARNIASGYINGQNCSIENAKKISEFLGIDLYTLMDKTLEEPQINYTTPCRNQACPLNKDCICINDVVLSGKAGCDGKYLVKDKISWKRTRATKGVVVHNKKYYENEVKNEI